MRRRWRPTSAAWWRPSAGRACRPAVGRGARQHPGRRCARGAGVLRREVRQLPLRHRRSEGDRDAEFADPKTLQNAWVAGGGGGRGGGQAAAEATSAAHRHRRRSRLPRRERVEGRWFASTISWSRWGWPTARSAPSGATATSQGGNPRSDEGPSRPALGLHRQRHARRDCLPGDLEMTFNAITACCSVPAAAGHC